MNFLYRIGWLLSNFVRKFVYRMKVYGLENVPYQGAFILASNHISYGDPPLLGSVLKRSLHYMAKKELFEVFLLGKILPRVNAHPVNRRGLSR